jgi:hypothetical protein
MAGFLTRQRISAFLIEQAWFNSIMPRRAVFPGLGYDSTEWHSFDGMEHTQYISLALQYLYTRQLNQIQRILIPAAACMFLEVFVFISILKIRQPGQVAMAMF